MQTSAILNTCEIAMLKRSVYFNAEFHYSLFYYKADRFHYFVFVKFFRNNYDKNNRL